MQDYGDVTLLANSGAAVRLTATAKSGCATPGTPPATTDVFSNLLPAELDVDAGEPFGLQVQSQIGKTALPAQLAVGSSFVMNLRINSASSALIAYEVRSWPEVSVLLLKGGQARCCLFLHSCMLKCGVQQGTSFGVADNPHVCALIASHQAATT